MTYLYSILETEFTIARSKRLAIVPKIVTKKVKNVRAFG